MAKKSKKASQTGSREPNLLTIAYAARLERQINREAPSPRAVALARSYAPLTNEFASNRHRITSHPAAAQPRAPRGDYISLRSEWNALLPRVVFFADRSARSVRCP